MIYNDRKSSFAEVIERGISVLIHVILKVNKSLSPPQIYEKLKRKKIITPAA